MKELDFARIGNRIREIRMEKHLTQEFVADRTGVNATHISNVELNKSKVSLTLLVRICDVLGVTLDYMLQNEYHAPASMIEQEIVNTLKNLSDEKKETLLRIAKVL